MPAMDTPKRLLDAWLRARLDARAVAWLQERIEHAEREGADARFFMSFSAVPRKLGKADLALSEAEREAARLARPGWQPGRWSVDQAGRTRLVLALAARESDAYRRTLDPLFEDADLGEQVALYQALPLLPFPDAHRARAAEGIRSNMKAVFEAVASYNPYPAEQLDDRAWNQLVLKALFIGSPLYAIQGLDLRINPELAGMLCDYAHERWAAGRLVSPELWRCVGPVAEGAQLDDLRRVLETGRDAERLAVALAARNNPAANTLLSEHPDVVARSRQEGLDWPHLAGS